MPRKLTLKDKIANTDEWSVARAIKATAEYLNDLGCPAQMFLAMVAFERIEEANQAWTTQESKVIVPEMVFEDLFNTSIECGLAGDMIRY